MEKILLWDWHGHQQALHPAHDIRGLFYSDRRGALGGLSGSRNWRVMG